MTLRELISGLTGARLIGDGDVEVKAVRDDSRQVQPGDVFVAVRGIRSDGHAFVQTAIDRGAVAVVVERELEAAKARLQAGDTKASIEPHSHSGVLTAGGGPRPSIEPHSHSGVLTAGGRPRPSIVIVPSGARALGELIGVTLGNPASAMTLIGITGTNGKTTTTYLVEAILAAAGKKPGVIGTVSYRWAGQSHDAPYTTPTPQVLHETLAAMKHAGCTHVVMEVSSAALSMDRLAGIELDVGAFSNLTQDHLDVHGSMDAYRDAKKRLFADHLHRGVAVVNLDDPEGAGMAAAAPRSIGVSIAPGSTAEIHVVSETSSVRGIDATFATPRGDVALEAKPLIGRYNVANLALAVGISEALGLPHESIVRGIAELPGVPGRVERVANAAELDILVDYAHTPDALRNVLSALRPLTKRRLICVFGCGGDRDPTKRPKMGAAVAELADLAVVTSDNPRTEDPRAIIDMILPAVPRPFFVDVDRRVAIRAAITEATPGDVIVIAGKGHEDYQILGTTKHHFDDREEAAAAVDEREHRLLAGVARDAGGELVGDANAKLDRITIDSRQVVPGSLYVAIRGEKFDGHRFCPDAIRAGAVAVMVDRDGRQWAPALVPDMAPDLHASAIVVDDTRIALGKVSRAHRRAWAKQIVAITGSAGKTTTKELTRAALAIAGTTLAAEGSLNNETGVPLTLLALRLFHQYGVIEMGMRGKGQIEYLTRLAEPDVAVVVNAGTAHLELLGTTDAIAAAKAEIWLGLRPGGTIVRPADDARLETLAREHQPRARHVTFGEERDADVRLTGYEPTDAGGILQIEAFGDRHELRLQLVGKHAAIDACAALAAAHAAGASIDQALVGLARARPAAMRGEIVEIGGRKVIVDCYNANPASMAAALRTLAERARGGVAIAVVGDMLELGDHARDAHRDVGILARELGLSVIALGEHAKIVADAAGKGAEVVLTPAQAAEQALARSESGGWILLKASRGMRLERVLDEMKEQTL